MGSSRVLENCGCNWLRHSMATALRGRFGLNQQGKVEGPACRMGSLPPDRPESGFCVLSPDCVNG